VAREVAQPDELDRLVGAAAALVLRQGAELGQEFDVGLHGAPRQQRRVLEDIADLVGADPHVTLAGGGEAGGDPQQHARPAAGWTDDADELPGSNAQVEAGEGDGVVSEPLTRLNVKTGLTIHCSIPLGEVRTLVYISGVSVNRGGWSPKLLGSADGVDRISFATPG
jgi:hypothetical protein